MLCSVPFLSLQVRRNTQREVSEQMKMCLSGNSAVLGKELLLRWTGNTTGTAQPRKRTHFANTSLCYVSVLYWEIYWISCVSYFWRYWFMNRGSRQLAHKQLVLWCFILACEWRFRSLARFQRARTVRPIKPESPSCSWCLPDLYYSVLRESSAWQPSCFKWWLELDHAIHVIMRWLWD